jgi:hypothetical protein
MSQMYPGFACRGCGTVARGSQFLFFVCVCALIKLAFCTLLVDDLPLTEAALNDVLRLQMVDFAAKTI